MSVTILFLSTISHPDIYLYILSVCWTDIATILRDQYLSLRRSQYAFRLGQCTALVLDPDQLCINRPFDLQSLVVDGVNWTRNYTTYRESFTWPALKDCAIHCLIHMKHDTHLYTTFAHSLLSLLDEESVISVRHTAGSAAAGGRQSRMLRQFDESERIAVYKSSVVDDIYDLADGEGSNFHALIMVSDNLNNILRRCRGVAMSGDYEDLDDGIV